MFRLCMLENSVLKVYVFVPEAYRENSENIVNKKVKLILNWLLKKKGEKGSNTQNLCKSYWHSNPSRVESNIGLDKSDY